MHNVLTIVLEHHVEIANQVGNLHMATCPYAVLGAYHVLVEASRLYQHQLMALLLFWRGMNHLHILNTCMRIDY